MKKVTAFVGSARKHGTYQSARRFLASLQSLGEAEVEVILLNDYRVETCKGCKSCFEKGEALCPYSGDDRDTLIGKILFCIIGNLVSIRAVCTLGAHPVRASIAFLHESV